MGKSKARSPIRVKGIMPSDDTNAFVAGKGSAHQNNSSRVDVERKIVKDLSRVEVIGRVPRGCFVLV